MTKIKDFLAIVLIIVLLAGVGFYAFKYFSPCAPHKFEDGVCKLCGADEEVDEVVAIADGEAIVQGNTYAMPKSMSFTQTSMQTMSSGDSLQATITATVLPVDAANKQVDWYVAWSDDATRKSEAVTDYITVVPQSDGSTTATVHCWQGFGDDVIILRVVTREAGFEANCLVTFLGKPEALEINVSSLGTKKTTSYYSQGYFELSSNESYTLDLGLNNAIGQVADISQFNFAIEIDSDVRVEVGNGFVLGVPVAGTLTEIQYSDLLKNYSSRLLSASIVNAKLVLTCNGVLESFYAFVTGVAPPAYQKMFNRIVNDYDLGYIKIRITETTYNLKSDWLIVNLVSGVSGVSLSDNSLIF